MEWMQRNTSGNLFHGFDVVDVAWLDGSDEGTCTVTLKAPDQVHCPHCGEKHAVKHGQPVKIHDLPFGDHPVILLIQEGRYQCPVLRRNVPYPYPDREGKLTRRLMRYVQRHQGRVPHRDLAARVGLSATHVLRIQHEAVQGPSLPDHVRHLGLDDIYINKAKYLVAVDLETGMILKLERLATIQEGRADLFTFAGFLGDLPQAEVVALDMHADQLAAARTRWPEATTVIDKRHLLQTIDRDLLSVVRQVILHRHSGTEMYSVRQAVRQFGAAAYPYLYLTSLVQRRSRHLTPGDYAAWTLIRQEGNSSQNVLPGRVLWEAWRFREALYDLYDPSRPVAQFAAGLDRWRTSVKDWQKSVAADLSPAERPLSRILWAVTNHRDECVAYSQTGLTNARTELANHHLRLLMRTGHRYDTATLIHLANRRILGDQPSVFPILVPPDSGLNMPAGPVSLTDQTATPPPRQAVRQPEPRPKRPSRHRRQADPAYGLPPHIWEWLHQKQEPNRRNSLRWLHEVLTRLPQQEDLAWHLCNAGTLSGAGGLTVSQQQRQRWEAVVCHLYVSENLDHLTVKERKRQALLKNVQIDDLRDDPQHTNVGEAYRLLASARFIVLPPELDNAIIHLVSIV